MNDTHGQPELPAPGNPNELKQDTIQAILQKVIVAHQQALALLSQTEAAYGRLIPRQLLTLLDRDNIVNVKLGDQVERKLTILFSDIRNFTPLSESMTPSENFDFINSYLSQMEPVISKHRGIIDKYMGDAIMAMFTHSADDALSGAIAMLEKLNHYNAGRLRAGYVPIRIGIGLNSGIVMIGTVGGANRMDSTVIGDAVNLTARIQGVTKIYQEPLLISHNTLNDLADPSKYDIRFLDRIRVKGKIQPLSLYEVFSGNPAALRDGKHASRPFFEQAIACYHMQQIPRAKALLNRCLEIAPEDAPARIYLERCEEFLATGQHYGTNELNHPLEWREEFRTGIAQVDGEHARLFEQVNGFIARIARGETDAYPGLFTYLADYAQRQLRLEESLMRVGGYPFAESHVQEHQRFVENFTVLHEETEAGTGDPLFLSFRTQLLLFNWFGSHIAKSDRHMGRYLAGRQPA